LGILVARRTENPPAIGVYWLILAGRGAGKTRTGAETVRHWIYNEGLRYVNLIAATESDGSAIWRRESSDPRTATAMVRAPITILFLEDCGWIDPNRVGGQARVPETFNH
jgi:phage terminase large subunit-like protein